MKQQHNKQSILQSMWQEEAPLKETISLTIYASTNAEKNTDF